MKNEFKHGRTEDNKVTYEGDEFKIRYRVSKKDKEAEKEDEGEIELQFKVNNIKEDQVIANGWCPTDQEGKVNEFEWKIN